MSKVLITGGAGFIGFHLARSLAESGHQVDLLDNFARGIDDDDLRALLSRPGVRLIEADLLDSAALARLDDDYRHIYHFAAIIGVTHVLNRPYDVLRDNTLMLAAMLDLARCQKALDRFMFTSTSEVYAGSLQHLDMPVPTPEDTVIALPDLGHPRTSYMLSKLYGEAMCRQSGVPCTIVRPHNVYGPRMGMVHVVPELLGKAHALAEGGVLPVASVEHRRAFCHIDDAVAMIAAAMAAPAGLGATLNLGNQDTEISIGQLAAIIAATVGRAITVEPAPVTPGSPSRRCPDMTRMIAVTGYQPSISVADGVARTYAWYRANVFEGKGDSAL